MTFQHFPVMALDTGAVAAGEPVVDVGVAMQMEHQQGEQCCWAAVAASIAGYTGHLTDTGGPFTQCAVAGAVLGNGCCDGTGRIAAACDRAAALDTALAATRNLQNDFDGTVTAAQLATELSAEPPRPVAIAIKWDTTDILHFCAIVRLQVDAAGRETVFVGDPLNGPWHGSLADLNGNYTLQRGHWDRTYLIT